MKNIDELKQKVQTLKETEPKLRARDLADKLNISEAELTSLDVGQNVTRLIGDWKSLLMGMKSMGCV